MKKIFSILVLSIMAVLNFTFVSCNKEEDNKEQSSYNTIVGTWSYVENYGNELTITFKSDGTGFEYEKGYFESFTYKIKNNILTIRYDGVDEAFSYHYEIADNGNTLYIYDDDGWIEKYVRKS